MNAVFKCPECGKEEIKSIVYPKCPDCNVWQDQIGYMSGSQRIDFKPPKPRF